MSKDVVKFYIIVIWMYVYDDNLVPHYSHNMANLIPEVRVNKNGVAVTKHVNPERKAKKPGSNVLPAPSAGKGTMSRLKQLEDTEGELAEFLHNEMFVKKYRMSDKSREKILGTLHEDTLEILEGTIRDTPRGLVPFHNAIGDCLRDRNFADLNNMAVVADLIKENSDSNYSKANWEVAGLNAHIYVGAEPYDWSFSSEEEKEQPRAIVKAMQTLDYSTYLKVTRTDRKKMLKYLKSESLHDLILQRPQDVDRIVQILNDRKMPMMTNRETETLIGLLDQDAETPLVQGLL